MNKKKKCIVMLSVLFLAVILLFPMPGQVTHAAGLVDDTINAENEYSKYALENYQLDFFVDTSWGWLPWNWKDGIGKQVMYGIYALTNGIWTISLYLSNATGYLVQEAYSLDFVSDTADAVGKNMQTLAGVTSDGISTTSGFYIGFSMLLVLVLGVYVMYTGLIKRETSKAIQAAINFVVIFVLSAVFIAYAPNYIKMINEFSVDVSTASLDIGTKMVMPETSSSGKDSVALIRDNLFAIQIEKPWLILQYGTTDIEAIGADRVKELVSLNPDKDGEAREAVVKSEIEDRENVNLSVTKAVSRLGTVFFLFFFNLFITIFVFLLTGMMILSQILFIIYAMFLPVSFLIGMIPGFQGTVKQAVMKLFNTIMMRAGVTLVITVAFSISAMLYALAGSYPFFLIAFLQIITFGGIYFKLNDLLNMFALNGNDSQQAGRRMLRKPNMLLRRQTRKLSRNLRRMSRNTKTKSNGTWGNGAGESGTWRSRAGESGNGAGESESRGNEAGGSGTGGNRTGGSGTRGSGTGGNGTRRSGTGEGGTGENGTRGNRTGESGARGNGAGESGARRSGTGEGGTKRSRTGGNRTGESGTRGSEIGESGTGGNQATGNETRGADRSKAETKSKHSRPNQRSDSGVKQNPAGNAQTKENNQKERPAADHHRRSTIAQKRMEMDVYKNQKMDTKTRSTENPVNAEAAQKTVQKRRQGDGSTQDGWNIKHEYLDSAGKEREIVVPDVQKQSVNGLEKKNPERGMEARSYVREQNPMKHERKRREKARITNKGKDGIKRE